jgi:nitrite reductase/ring-hydroxylating ferredoxin subunit
MDGRVMVSRSGNVGRISRRGLLRVAGTLVGTPIAVAFASMLQRLQARQAPREVVVPPDIQGDVTFVDTVIVSRDHVGALRVLSARCPHLGCQIDRLVDGVLVCPCHGSRFHPDGSVVSGPASSPLADLPYEIVRTTGNLIVHVP